VRSENNFKFKGLVYDINILKSYEVYIRCGNSCSFCFNYLENREKLVDRKGDFILRFILLVLQYLPLRYILQCLVENILFYSISFYRFHICSYYFKDVWVHPLVEQTGKPDHLSLT